MVRPARVARQDWDTAFQYMADEGDDGLLDPATLTQFDAEEWGWPAT
ncbi:MAG: hypothetical protein LC797_24225 [Chloroflexi bacterium]|nr:hypothetical protein [Chloroflexota bacterium]